MCGAPLGSHLPQGASDVYRRANSFKDLHELAGCPNGGLKSSKSAAELPALLHTTVVAELASLRLTLAPQDRSVSAQSSGEDTSRGSPTSGYEQLLRSRSPSAVLFSSEEAAAASATGSLLGCAGGTAQDEAAGGHTLPASPADAPWGTTLLARDHPFLESASRFCVVEVPSRPSAPPPMEPPSGPHPSSSLPSEMEHSMAAVAAAAPRAGSDDAAAANNANSPVAAAGAALPATHQPSPFARLAAHQMPSLISHSPPHPRPPLSPSSCRSGASTPPPASSAPASCRHSRSGSLAAEFLAAAAQPAAQSLTRRGSVDCTVGHSAHLSEGHAAEELFYRLNHARQTVDFVKRQAQAFSALNKAAMGVWEALELLNSLREYEAALLGDSEATPEMPLLEHALQCAEACRAAFPDEDYMHLAGLLSPLGKLLAHAKFGAEPQFAICGETFPVGCRFHPAVNHSQYFSANPDRRKRLYNSPTGVYRQGCGLGGVLMSWGAGEYLHLVLRLNGARLPPEALFCLRHQKLRCVFRQGAPYSELLSEFDRVQLPRLAKFQQLCRYQRAPRAEPVLVPAPGARAAEGEAPPLRVAPELKAYYDRLLAKYLPQGVLLW